MKYHGIDADQLDDEQFAERFAEALWFEQREIANLTTAIVRAFGADDD